jgi:histone deacetylase 1/2
MHAPIDSHWVFIKRILCYLQRTTSYGLYITRSSSFALHCFTNADWADSINDRKSIGGYLVFFSQTLISGKSSKQRTVACSSTKIEYKTLADRITEVIWLQNLLIDLQIPFTSAPTIWCDNLSATYLSTNPIFHAPTKHVEVDYYFVRDRIAKKEIQICLSLLRINFQMSFLSCFLLLSLLHLNSSFGSILHPRIEGPYYIYIYIRNTIRLL